MDFAPEDMEAVRTASKELIATCPWRSSLWAAELLMPNTARTVADILALAECPADRLRLVVER